MLQMPSKMSQKASNAFKKCHKMLKMPPKNVTKCFKMPTKMSQKASNAFKKCQTMLQNAFKNVTK